MKSLLMLLMLAVASLQACGKSVSASESQQYPDGEIPFPEIPADITEPVERAAYVLMHFWDDFDFTNHSMSLDTTFMEKNFANYAQFYQFVGDSVTNRAIGILVDDAQKDAKALQMVYGVGCKYLGERQSPAYDEAAYIALMESMLRRDLLSTSDALRAQYNLRLAKKNRPGMAAADFRFEDRRGGVNTLYKSNRSPYTLLVFYDPDCDTCHEMISLVTANNDVTGLVDRGIVSVVAVYADGDKLVWDDTKGEMPAKWIIGYDLDSVIDNEIYSYDSLPSLYLLDANKRVILKEPTLEQLIDYAHSH